MNSAARMMCFALVSALFCLGLVGCAVDIAQQPSQSLSARTKAQIEQEREAKAATKAKAGRERKARAAEELRAKREAAAKAKREAAVKAKAKREEKARLAKLDAEAKKQAKAEIAQAKRERKTRAAEELRAKREAAAKAKREDAVKAKAKREEKAKLAKLDAGAKKQAKAEITQAKRERKRKLAALDARAKKQAKKEAKKLAEDAKAEQASLKRTFEQDKAKITAEHKQAKTKFTKEENKRLDAEYEKKLRRLEADYKKALAKLKAKAKAQTKQIAQAKSQKKAELTELAAKAKKEAKKLAKEIKAKQTSLKREFDRDKAKAATEYKQAKAAAVKRKAKKEEKAGLDAEYKRTVALLKGEYKEALAKLKEKAKPQAAQHAQAKSEKKAELAELDAKAKEQAKRIKAEQASLKSTLAQDKRKAKPYSNSIAKPDADYKKKFGQLKAEYKEALAKLKAKAKAQITQYEREKKQIEAEYEETVAKIKMRLIYRRETARVAKLKLPEDTSPRLTARELSISGNTLISTAELLTNMPLVYNASDEPLEKAERDYLYDFRVLLDIVLQPGQPRKVSARTIQGFTQYILSVYQNWNYAGIYVYVPAEAIKDGTELRDEVLPITVLEARVTDVTVKTYDPNQNATEKGYLLASAVQEWSPVKAGQVANQKELDDFVNLLNLNPDRYVSAVVTKGAEPGSLAVAYDIYEANPWHWFIQVDNSGTKERQLDPRIGVINTNLLGIDDTFTAIYQAPWDATIDENYSLYGSYDFPLLGLGPWLRLNLYGGHSEFDISPETGIFDFLGRGTFYGGILRYNLLQTAGWFFDIKGSLEHTRSKVNNTLFPTLGTDIKFWLWGTGLDMHRSDDMSNTSVTFDRFESWGGESSGDEFRLARTDAESMFTIYTASAAHSQYLDPNKVGRVSTSFRWVTSDERLVPAKMTAFGGMYTVRGYDEYEIVADGGILASVQYEFDLVKYDESKQINQGQAEQQKKTKKPMLKKLAPVVFADYGRTSVRHPIAGIGEKKHVTMFSVGVGAIVELGDNFTGVVYYGHPLRKTNTTRRDKGRLNVSLMLRW